MKSIPYLVLIVLVLASVASCTNSEAFERICLVQLGPDLPAEKLAVVQQQLRASYHVPVVLLPPLPLPDSAFYAARQRYRAPAILNYLASLKLLLRRTDKLIALTSKDIEMPLKGRPHWGIMGLAKSIGGQQAVVSLYRLSGKDPRLRRVAVHEVGHMIGLEHCTGPANNRCVMRDAQGSGAVVDRCALAFCSQCARVLDR